MAFSLATQKASALAAAGMFRRGRVEGSAAQLNYHADVLDSLAKRIETAEARQRSGDDPLHYIEMLIKVCPGGAVKDAAQAFLNGKDAAE